MNKMSNNIIYHYTSPEGLKAILESHSLRFTNYKFLNDTEEGMFDKENECIKNVIEKELCKIENNDNIKTFLKKVQKSINCTKGLDDIIIVKNPRTDSYEEKKYDHYVFSLSIEKDSLPMWNYYVKDKKYEGYNIGFELEILEKLIKEKTNKYGNIYNNYINYDMEKIHTIVQNIIKIYLDVCHKTREGIPFDCASELLTNKIFFKNCCFEPEKEYRFVFQEEKKDKKRDNGIFKYNFFIKNGVFIPYVDIDLEQDIKTIIKSITIAPLVEKDIAKKGLEQFLINNGYEVYNEKTKKGIKIETSNCPIRY